MLLDGVIRYVKLDCMNVSDWLSRSHLNRLASTLVFHQINPTINNSTSGLLSGSRRSRRKASLNLQVTMQLSLLSTFKLLLTGDHVMIGRGIDQQVGSIRNNVFHNPRI